MAQVLLPVADIATGSWGTTPLWSKINDDTPTGDGVTIISEAVGNNTNTSNADTEGPTSGITDPSSNVDHVLRARWNSSSTRNITGHLELWQGVPGTGSLIADATVELTSTTETETSLTLSGTEADNITDYNDLHFRLWGRGTQGGPDRQIIVELIDLTIPDEGAKEGTASGTGSGTGSATGAEATFHSRTASGTGSGTGAATGVPTHKGTASGTGSGAGAATGEEPAAATAHNQRAFRVRDSDPAINADTGPDWKAAENVDVSIHLDEFFRLRFEVEETGGVTDGGVTYKPQFRVNIQSAGYGSWADVPVGVSPDTTPLGETWPPTPDTDESYTEHFGVMIMSGTKDGPGFVNDAATTDILTTSAGGFVAGAGMHDSVSPSVTLLSQHTELEWPIVISRWYDDSGDTGRKYDAGDTFEFRVVESDGTVLDAYDQTPEITATERDGHIGGTFIEEPGDVGPFADANGNLYFITEYTINSNAMLLQKSTNAGIKWDEATTTGRPIVNDPEGAYGFVDADGDRLHIITHKGSDLIDYHLYHMSSHGTTPDTWDTIDDEIDADAGNPAICDACAIVKRPNDGKIFAFYAGLESGNATLWFNDDNADGTWQTRREVDLTASIQFSGAQVVLGPISDDIYFFYMDQTNGEVFMRIIDSGGDTIGSRVSVASGLSTNNAENNTVRAVAYDDGGVEVVFITWHDRPGGDFNDYRTVRDGSLQTAGVATDVGVERSGGGGHSGVADISVLEKEVHIVYSTISDQDLWHARNDDEGGFGTDVELQDGVEAFYVRTGIWVNSAGNGGGTDLGYGWEDKGADGLAAGFVEFNTFELVSGTKEGTASGTGSGAGAATGQRTASRTASGTGSGTGAATGQRTASRTGSGTGSGAGSATGSRRATRTASGTGSGSGAATGQRTASRTAAGTGSGTGAATGQPTHKATATSTGSGTGAATGVKTGNAAGTGSGTGAATGNPTHKGTASGTGSGTGAATGVNASGGPKERTAAGSGSGTGAATGQPTHKATASATGSGTGAATGVKTGNASGTGSGAGAATGVRRATRTAAGTGSGTGSATGAKAGTASGTGSGAGAATGQRIASRTASGTGSGTGAATGLPTHKGTAAGTGSGAGSATGAKAGTASGTGSGTGAASGEKSLVKSRTASGTGSGTGAATGLRKQSRTASGTGSGTGAATGLPTHKGTAAGTGSGTGAATGREKITHTATAAGVGIGRGFAFAPVPDIPPMSFRSIQRFRTSSIHRDTRKPKARRKV